MYSDRFTPIYQAVLDKDDNALLEMLYCHDDVVWLNDHMQNSLRDRCIELICSNWYLKRQSDYVSVRDRFGGAVFRRAW